MYTANDAPVGCLAHRTLLTRRSNSLLRGSKHSSQQCTEECPASRVMRATVLCGIVHTSAGLLAIIATTAGGVASRNTGPRLAVVTAHWRGASYIRSV